MKINSKNLRHVKIGIREELLLGFVLITIVALGSIGIITGSFLNSIGNSASDQTSEALEIQVQSDMMNKTYNLALTLETQLEHIAADVDGLAESINNILSNPIEYSPRTSYYHVDELYAGTILFNETVITENVTYYENQPPDIHYDSDYELNISDSYSHYLLYNDSYNAMGGDPFNLDNPYGDLINRTAQLDPIFSDVWHRNPIYAWIYVDFAMGVQRTFPYTGVDITIFGGNGEEFHDYKTDDWYIDAASTNGEIVWTSPYIDPYLGWMISISRAVYNGTETLGNFVGVIGLDILLNTITDTVGDISFLETGYGFLIDSDGVSISHPGIEFDPSEEDYIDIQDVEPISDEIYSDMVGLNSGFTSLTKDNELYFLSYAPVTISGYSLGILVPQEEVVGVVRVLEDAIDLQIRRQTTVTLFIILGVITIVLVVGLKIADNVVKPIKRLTDLAIRLSTEDVRKTALTIDSNFDEGLNQDDEIGDLTRAFKNLLLSVQEDANEE